MHGEYKSFYWTVVTYGSCFLLLSYTKKYGREINFLTMLVISGTMK